MVPPPTGAGLGGGGSYKDVPGCHRRLHICRPGWHHGAFVCVLDGPGWSISHLSASSPPPWSTAGTGSFFFFFFAHRAGACAAVIRTEAVIDGSEPLLRDAPVPPIVMRRLQHCLSGTRSHPGDGLGPAGILLGSCWGPAGRPKTVSQAISKEKNLFYQLGGLPHLHHCFTEDFIFLVLKKLIGG